jgi:hypothetical protein
MTVVDVLSRIAACTADVVVSGTSTARADAMALPRQTELVHELNHFDGENNCDCELYQLDPDLDGIFHRHLITTLILSRI